MCQADEELHSMLTSDPVEVGIVWPRRDQPFQVDSNHPCWFLWDVTGFDSLGTATDDSTRPTRTVPPEAQGAL
jgi:hypothetical protein